MYVKNEKEKSRVHRARGCRGNWQRIRERVRKKQRGRLRDREDEHRGSSRKGSDVKVKNE